jgi:hypothetical protein
MRVPQAGLKMREAFLVGARLLLVALQIARVMVQEERAMVRLEFLEAGVFRQSGLVLDELQMHGRNDRSGSV